MSSLLLAFCRYDIRMADKMMSVLDMITPLNLAGAQQYLGAPAI